VPLAEAVDRVLAGEITNSIAVGGILAAKLARDGASTRPVDAPWPLRPKAFAARKAAST
jgi:8-oxo-dGDP phosphatase